MIAKAGGAYLENLMNGALVGYNGGLGGLQLEGIKPLLGLSATVD